MRRWKPQPSPWTWATLLLLIAALGAAALPIAQLLEHFRAPAEQWMFDLATYGTLLLALALLGCAGFLAYRLAAALTLSYELDRNGLYIAWLGNRAVIPLDQIISVDAGARLRLPLGPLQRIGSYWGGAFDADQRPVQLFSTQPPEQALLIHTPALSYAIAPVDHESFVLDLEQRRKLGVTKPLASALEPGRLFLYAFWADRHVQQLLLGALALNLLAGLVLALSYPGLPDLVALRFDATGQVAELQPRGALLYIPLASLGQMLGNMALGLALYPRQQLSARLLQGASLIIQILCLLALATLVR